MPKNELQTEFTLWLQTMLADDKRRAMLRAMVQQYELPVIQIAGRRGRLSPSRSSRATRHVRT